MGLEAKIIECMKANMSEKEAAKIIGYSSKQLGRKCKEIFKHTYTELRQLMVYAEILKRCMNGDSNQLIANCLFDGDTSNLYAFVRDFSDIPLKKIVIEGGRRMTPAMKQIYEAQVINLLTSSPEGKNMTLKELGVPRCVIESLRKKGFDIISVPGRYNGGYNLGRTEKNVCLRWINKIRENRYGLQGNYSF